MDQRDVPFHPPLGERGQPIAGRVRDPPSRPIHRRPSLRVEVLDLATTCRGRVVIAADPDGSDRRQALDDRVGLGAVADHVAEVPDGVDRAEVGEDRVERDEIAVDVREDGDPHRRSA